MGKPLIAVVGIVASLCYVGRVFCAEDASNGFGSELNWRSPKELKGFDWTSNKKPVMYLFNQPWCGACNALKTDFQENEENMLEISKNFILVNVGGDDNNNFSEAYQPDGGYIPRVLFADAQNNLKPDISNPARPDQYKYYYTSVDDVSLPRIGRTSPSKFVVFTSEEFERSSGYMSPVRRQCNDGRMVCNFLSKPYQRVKTQKPSQLEIVGAMQRALSVLGVDTPTHTEL